MLGALERTFLLGAALLGISFPITQSFACECVPPPPPCEAVGQTPLVFLGTVTQVEEKSPGFKAASMHVDHSYKGDLKDTVELFDDGMCDGPLLETGKQYLMYTSRTPTGAVPARGCTRSRRVEDAEEDLEFLKQYSTGSVKTHINGTVVLFPDDRKDPSSTPLKDVLVRLSGGGHKFETKTDALGAYSFSGVPPSQYTISAVLEGYRHELMPQDSLTLHANGCVETSLAMKVDRRVEGIVRDGNGDPVANALVQMGPTKHGLKVWERPVLLDVSREDGRYAIDGIPPGEFYLGVNIENAPTKESPYPVTYYPGTPDVGLATRIHFVPGASVQDFGLTVSGKLPLIEIHGRIVDLNGNPPPPDSHPQVRIKEPDLSGQIERRSIDVDSQGRFTFQLCEGVRYSAFAFWGPVLKQISSAPIAFTPTAENDSLTLVVDKTTDEFLKLRAEFR
jgi:hypothetical protein